MKEGEIQFFDSEKNNDTGLNPGILKKIPQELWLAIIYFISFDLLSIATSRFPLDMPFLQNLEYTSHINALAILSGFFKSIFVTNTHFHWSETLTYLFGDIIISGIPAYIISYYVIRLSKENADKIHLATKVLISCLIYFIGISVLLLLFLGPYVVIYGPFLALNLILSGGILIILTLLFFKVSPKHFSISIKAALIPLILIFILIIMPALSPIKNCDPNDRKCIEKLAIAQGDTSLCDYSRGRESFYCYAEVYDKALNEKVCQSIKKAETKEDCYCKFTGVCAKSEDTLSVFHRLLNKWYVNNKSYSGFVEGNRKELESVVSKVKNEKNQLLTYSIYADKNEYSIRIRFNNENNFYCVNSINFAPFDNKQFVFDEEDFKPASKCPDNPEEKKKKENMANAQAEIVARGILTSLMKKWYIDTKSYVDFMTTPLNKERVDKVMKKIKDELGVEIEYYINTYPSAFVIKLRAKNDNQYYCKDRFYYDKIDISMKKDGSVMGDDTKTVGNDKNNYNETIFNSDTNCLDQPLSSYIIAKNPEEKDAVSVYPQFDSWMATPLIKN